MKHGELTKIAWQAGVSKSHLSMICSGKKRPSYATAKRLASATGTGVVVWLEGSPENIAASIEAARERTAFDAADRLRAMTDFSTGAA